MSKGNRSRQQQFHTPAAQAGRSDRWQEKRQRFADQQRGGGKQGSLRPSTYITIGAIALVVVFVGLMTLRGGATTASAEVLQQVPASTSSTDGGKVGISVQEVQQKKLVYWDYKANGKTTPLIAYVTPSGAVKVAIRMCEPCNGYTFHVEGNQIVCNTCGTRWDLETSRGISGGCLGYPPEVLSSSVVDGKITVDEATVAGWKARL